LLSTRLRRASCGVRAGITTSLPFKAAASHGCRLARASTMSDVDSLYNFEDDTGQPGAADTSYSNEWPLPERGGGASPRARSPRSDGASTTAALSFSTAAASAETRLEADPVEAVAAPGAGAVDAEEDDILDRLRREQAFPRRVATASFDGSASEDAPTPGRRSFATAADDASVDGEPPVASDDDTDAGPATDETPPQSPRASDSSEDFAAASGSVRTPTLLTVADLGDWSGGAAEEPAREPSPSPSDTAEARGRARRWSIGSDGGSEAAASSEASAAATPARDDSSYEDDFAPALASPRAEPRSPGTAGLAVGTRVEAIYGETDQFFPGSVEAANADGTYAIRYDAGGREAHVDGAFVRVILHGGASSSSGSSYETDDDDEASGATASASASIGSPAATDSEYSADEETASEAPSRARDDTSAYSEDFAEDAPAARPIDYSRWDRVGDGEDVVVLGAPRLGPRGAFDDAAAAAATTATQRARVEASYDEEDFELPDAPEFVRQLAIGVGWRLGVQRDLATPAVAHRLALDPRAAQNLVRRVRERKVPREVCRYARRVADQLRGRPKRRGAATAARFHATPAALDRVKIRASLALLRTTHDRVDKAERALFEASLPGGPIREDDPATKQRRLAGRVRADAAQRYVESDKFYARSALLGDGFAMFGEAFSEARAEHERRAEEGDAWTVRRRVPSPLDAAVATRDETRDNVAAYMRDVAADPKRAAFRDEILRLLHRGDEPKDFGLAPYRLGATAPGVFVS